MSQEETKMSRPIFLLGCHKSGTSLLRSLLDGHPDLFVIPIETHFFQATGHWTDYRMRRSWPKRMEREALITSHAKVAQSDLLTVRCTGAVFAGPSDVRGPTHLLGDTQRERPGKLLEAGERCIGALPATDRAVGLASNKLEGAEGSRCDVIGVGTLGR